MRRRLVSPCVPLLLFAFALMVLPASGPAPARAGAGAGPGHADEDPYRWLEQVTSKRALAWVAQQDSICRKTLTGDQRFGTLQARFLAILDSNQKLPTVEKLGAFYYNFWEDREHPRGLWRRTTPAEYRRKQPAWETVLDVDSLGRAENQSWVWKGASALPPEYRRCLVSLSRGGADAVVVREFDLVTKTFVQGGFTLPEAKSQVGWIDRDEIYVGTDFGPGSLTSSGYPRIVKRWKRGTPLSQASVVYQGRAGDLAVLARHDFTPGFERDYVARVITFFTDEEYLLRGSRQVRIEKPDDATADFFHEWLLLRLRSDWTVGGRTWPGGALIATRLDDFLSGKREFQMLFEPAARKSLDRYVATQNALVVSELDDVKSRLYLLRPAGETWTRTPIPGLPEFGSVEPSAVDPYDSDDYFLTITDFLTPTSLELGVAGDGPPERLKQSPEFFDPRGLAVSQHEAVSKDGTHVPYFEVARETLALDGTAPTLLTGYGGFEVAETPRYSGIEGSGWLEKGGVLVLANIRGGGEFGPQWHEAAIKANRPRAYEDFIAVARDLIARHVTSPRHLGCIGASNGGLLVGNMLTMRPDLFGAIVCESPLLDMKRYSHLLAGASWVGEYGDPDDPGQWAFIRTFSPYQNVKRSVTYPPTLFTSSTRDDRVDPAHARKMVARMEAQGHEVLYYENTEGGHSSGADNRQRAFMNALDYTFLWEHLQ